MISIEMLNKMNENKRAHIFTKVDSNGNVITVTNTMAEPVLICIILLPATDRMCRKQSYCFRNVARGWRSGVSHRSVKTAKHCNKQLFSQSPEWKTWVEVSAPEEKKRSGEEAVR